MSKQIVNTWTFCLLMPIIISNFCFASPVGKIESGPKTMYDALVLKCPQIEKSELQENLKDVFTTRCADWTIINTTNSLSTEGKTNAQCLVLYESLLSFCTSLGESLNKLKNLSPTVASLTNYSIDKICLGDNSLSVLKNPEHNISSFLQPVTCVMMCGEIGQTFDLCKFAYYFATFNASKFLTEANSLKKIADIEIVNKETTKKNLPEQVQAAKVENPAPPQDQVRAVPSSKQEAQKPKHTDKDKSNEDNNGHPLGVPPIQPVVSHNENQAEPKQEVQAQAPAPVAPQPPDAQNLVPLQKQPEHSDAGKDKNLDNIPPVAGKQVPVDPNTDDKLVNQVPVPDKKQPEPVLPAQNPNNIPIGDGNDDAAQADIADEADQIPEDEEEFEQGEPNLKLQPVVSEDTKTTSKKVKPNTVEDEAVSNDNIPEDEMDGDSYFFSYFTVIMCLFIVGYVGYHNRQKILALLLEGKKGKRHGRTGRRPNSANYHKLDSNLEEAISSSCTKNASNVIY